MDYTVIYWAVSILVLACAVKLTLFNADKWIGEKKYLCEDCKYNRPEDCLKPERPTALDCTAYRTGS